MYDWRTSSRRHRTEGIRKINEFQEKLESQIVEMNKISEKKSKESEEGAGSGIINAL